jgi:hypothetical protein
MADTRVLVRRFIECQSVTFQAGTREPVVTQAPLPDSGGIHIGTISKVAADHASAFFDPVLKTVVTALLLEHPVPHEPAEIMKISAGTGIRGNHVQNFTAGHGTDLVPYQHQRFRTE